MNLWQRTKAAWATLRGKSERSVFAGADYNRLMMDWITSNLSVNKEVRMDILKLRERARAFARDTGFAVQFFKLLEHNVVGPKGFRLQSLVRNNDQTLNKGINDRIELAWQQWSRRVTMDERMTLRDVCKLALRTAAQDGEVFVQLITAPDRDFGFRLQLLDADLLDHEFNEAPRKDGTEITMGIEHDRYGKRVAYYFWTVHPSDGIRQKRERVRVPADQIIHLYVPLRPTQMRGITWFAPVMVNLRHVMGYVEAELVAARTGAAKMGFFKHKEGSLVTPSDGGADAPKPQIDASPGSFHWLPPNIDFEAWNPDHPSGAFQPFLKAVMRMVASGLGVSYNAWANDLEGVNYSSLRSGLLIERDTWQDLQQWFADQFLMPVYEAWIVNARLSGRLSLDTRDPQRFLDVAFKPRGWQWVDPLKDTQAGVLGIQNCLATRTELLAERGRDLEDVLEELAEEQRLADQYGVKLAAAVPAPGDQQGKDGQDDGDGSDPEDKADEEEDAQQDEQRAIQVVLNVPERAVVVENHMPAVMVNVPERSVSVNVPAPQPKRTVAVRDASGFIKELREVQGNE